MSNQLIKLPKFKKIDDINYIKEIFIKLFQDKIDNKEFRINLNEIKDFYKFKTSYLLQILSFNRIRINQLLYECEKVIDLEYTKIEHFSDFFYLVLLIEEDPIVINYIYSINLIKENNVSKNTSDEFKKIIISKTILNLINNYKGLEEYNDKKYEIKNLENENIKIIEDNINIINNFGLNLDLEYIRSNNIEVIYIEIINSIFKRDIFEKFEYLQKIINQLNLEEINFTETMINEIKKILDNQNSYTNKYLISQKKDLSDIKKINFYFILLKYILKNSFFIYQINSLLKTRKLILNLIKLDYNKRSISCQDNQAKQRLKYLFEKIIDLDYYKNKIENYQNKTIFIENKQTTSTESNSLDNSKQEYEYINSYICENDNPNNEPEILEKYAFFKFKKIFNNDSYDFIFETNNYYIIAKANNIRIYNNSYEEINKRNKVYFINAFESDDNKIILKVYYKNKIQEITYNQNENNFITKEILDDKNELDKIIFSIEEKKDLYYCCCENGIKIIDNDRCKNRKENGNIFDGLLMKSGIKINKNLISFISNKVISKGNDKIYFYNNKNKSQMKEIINENYSFTYSINGLKVIPVNKELIKENKYIKEESKILLCGCKKYIKGQKNGILLINIEEDNIINYHFYDTTNYEVYCFCPLISIVKMNILNNDNEILDTNYFLVGGFDKDRKKGIIRLYKIIYGKKFCDNKIEYIEDIIIKDETFKGFKGPINSMIQSKKNGEIIITCWDGNIYLFNPPIEDYLKYDKIVKSNISAKNFFTQKDEMN